MIVGILLIALVVFAPWIATATIRAVDKWRAPMSDSHDWRLTAVPRKWVERKWVLNLIILALGRRLPCRQLFRWIFFREVSDAD